MDRIKVDSSSLVSVGYKDRVLEVEFTNRKGNNPIYQYGAVPQDIYDALMKSGSKGKFFHQYIEPHYVGQRVQ